MNKQTEKYLITWDWLSRDWRSWEWLRENSLLAGFLGGFLAAAALDLIRALLGG